MKFQIVVINGSSDVGKDTFANFCADYVDYYANISTIDFTKMLARKCGWKGTTTDTDRKFLSDLKQLLVDYDDIPFKMVLKEVNRRHLEIIQTTNLLQLDSAGQKSIVFIRCKEPEEIDKLVKHFNAVSLLLTRKGIEVNPTNEADARVLDYNYQFVLGNDGTLDDLKVLAKTFVEKIFGET